MNTIELESGVCLGFGGTNARAAVCENGDIKGFNSFETPAEPEQFFGWMARHLLEAADAGQSWLVAGYPGPVTPDGSLVGPLENVSGMANQQYDLHHELKAADSEVGRVIEQGFTLIAVNDGILSAQAAADRIANHQYNRTAAIIVGTGVGAGMVDKDPNYTGLHRADTKHPYEIGHIMRGCDPLDTYEDKFSGPGLKKRFNSDPQKLPSEHLAWQELGMALGWLATTMGVMNGVELVVPCGGVGAGASNKYSLHLTEYMDHYRFLGNGAQKLFAPDVMYVPAKDSQVFEMFGAEGVMRDFVTRSV